MREAKTGAGPLPAAARGKNLMTARFTPARSFSDAHVRGLLSVIIHVVIPFA